LAWIDTWLFVGRNNRSCIKTELNRGVITESLLSKYDVSRKLSEVPVNPSPNVVRKD